MRNQLLALQGQAGNRQFLPNYHQMMAEQISQQPNPGAFAESRAMLQGGMRNNFAAQNMQQQAMWQPFQQVTNQMHQQMQPFQTGGVRGQLFGNYIRR